MRQSSTKTNNSQSKYWVFTINNPKPDYADVHGAKKWSYMVIGKEVGDEGTPHLQGFIEYETRTRFSTVKKQLPRAHIEPMYGTTTEAINYCKKDGDWEEYGQVPPENTRAGGASGGKAKMERYKSAISLAKKGDFDKMETDHPDMYWNNYHTMKRIAMDNPKKVEKLDKLDNEWIYGAPGLGKSWAAREENPGYYIKSHNKWWLGYRGEDVVIIDDISPHEGQFMGEHLKQWADIYPVPTETKGDGMVIRPKKIVITSNYSIEEIWGHDPVLVEALKRRFKERHIVNPFPGLLAFQKGKLAPFSHFEESEDDVVPQQYADRSMHSEEEHESVDLETL